MLVSCIRLETRHEKLFVRYLSNQWTEFYHTMAAGVDDVIKFRRSRGSRSLYRFANLWNLTSNKMLVRSQC